MITATAYVSPTLHAPVEIHGDPHAPGRIRVVTLPGGAGGWATPGRVLYVERAILRDIIDLDGTTAEQWPAIPPTAPPAPLAAPIEAEAYMRVLLARQAAWLDAQPGHREFSLRMPPLPEHFVEPGDEKWVILPEETPRPKRTPTPRVYRTAASIQAELDTINTRMAHIANSGPDDPAAVNLSPHSRSRAARTAGRRRFAQLDRDLANYTKLAQQRDTLTFQLATAQAREAASTPATPE